MSLLDTYRYAVIDELGEPDPASCSWYDNGNLYPWHTVDRFLNAAEEDVGNQLMSRGCEESLIKVQEVDLTDLEDDWTYVQHGDMIEASFGGDNDIVPFIEQFSKIKLIKDVTDDLPIHWIMEPFQHMDRYDSAIVLRQPRVVIFFRDGFMASSWMLGRTFYVYYIPLFGRLNGIREYTVTAGGSLYVSAPDVEVSGANGKGAFAQAEISAGSVTGVSPGYDCVGCRYGLDGASNGVTVTLTGGGGSGATVTATIGAETALPPAAERAMIYRAAQKCLRHLQRDAKEMTDNYVEALDAAVTALNGDRKGFDWNRRPRYKGITPFATPFVRRLR